MKKIYSLFILSSLPLLCGAESVAFEKIQNWTGSGPNRAALVIQFDKGRDYYRQDETKYEGTPAMVWGYRWEDGEQPTGETMFKEICKNSSRLSLLTQVTGGMGSVVCGVGYSLNQDVLQHIYFDFEFALDYWYNNFDFYNITAWNAEIKEAPGDNTPSITQSAIQEAIEGQHYIQHPLDARYGYPSYDYDAWFIDDDYYNDKTGITPWNSKWCSGWYEGYWSYFNGYENSELYYSGTGFSGRTLSDGAVDAWLYFNFDESQAGTMIPPDYAPGETVEYYYVPASISKEALNLYEAVRFFEKPDNYLPFIIHSSEDIPLNNLVMNLNIKDNLPTLPDLANLLSKDPLIDFDGETLTFYPNGKNIEAEEVSPLQIKGEWRLLEFENALVLSNEDFDTFDNPIFLPQTNSSLPGLNLNYNCDSQSIKVEWDTTEMKVLFGVYLNGDLLTVTTENNYTINNLNPSSTYLVTVSPIGYENSQVSATVVTAADENEEEESGDQNKDNGDEDKETNDDSQESDGATSGLENIENATGICSLSQNKIVVKGFSGYKFIISDLTGHTLQSFISTSEYFEFTLNVPTGLYIIHSDKGISKKIFIK